MSTAIHPTTEVQYAKVATRLAKQASRHLRKKTIGSELVVAYFLEHRQRYSMSTFRLYKNSLTWWLRDRRETNTRAYTELRSTTSAGLDKRSKRTSGKKAKTLSNADHLLLVDFLRSKRDRWGAADDLADLLVAGYTAGLRPAEWSSPKVVLGPPELTSPPGTTHTLNVPNAKASHGRANGESRLLHGQLTDEEAAAIAATIARFSRLSPKAYARYYKKLRDLMYRAVRQLWPKRARHPSIYTNRHQFKANAVAGGSTPAEVAAMLGHASDRTAPRNYARGISGDKNQLKISPDPVSLANVRNRSLTMELGLDTPAAPSAPTGPGEEPGGKV